MVREQRVHAPLPVKLTLVLWCTPFGCSHGPATFDPDAGRQPPASVDSGQSGPAVNDAGFLNVGQSPVEEDAGSGTEGFAFDLDLDGTSESNLEAVACGTALCLRVATAMSVREIALGADARGETNQANPGPDRLISSAYPRIYAIGDHNGDGWQEVSVQHQSFDGTTYRPESDSGSGCEMNPSSVPHLRRPASPGTTRPTAYFVHTLPIRARPTATATPS